MFSNNYNITINQKTLFVMLDKKRFNGELNKIVSNII